MMSLTKEEVETQIANIDVALADLDAQEVSYAADTIAAGPTGGPPDSPTEEEFLIVTTQSRINLEESRAELVILRDTLDFNIFTGE